MSFADEVAAIWPTLKDAGMLSVATDDDGDFDVGFARPGELRSDGKTISNEYEIEYQHADRPNLREGDALAISEAPSSADNGNYRVRQAPYVSAPGNAADGFFRCATLTKVP